MRTASVSRAKLDASMTAAEAVRAMIRAQYQVARANEEGVLNDTDAEFLHDFRVAVRRARSYLGQLREVFAAESGARLRKNPFVAGQVHQRADGIWTCTWSSRPATEACSRRP